MQFTDREIQLMKNYKKLQEENELLAASLAEKDVFIKQIVEEAPYPSNILVLGNKALALQPHAEIVAKIKADTLRKAAVDMPHFKEDSTNQILWLVEEADRIEREGK